MSQYFMILPFDGDHYSHTVLRLCGFSGASYTSELAKELGKLRENAEKNNQFVPKEFTSHMCIDSDEKDYYYGITNNLIYVFAKDLVELEDIHKEYYKEDDDVKDGVYCFNKEQALGTMSYIKTLPENRKIAIYRN